MIKYVLAAILSLILVTDAIAGAQLGASSDGTLNNDDGSYVTGYYVTSTGVLMILVEGNWETFNWCSTHERYECFDLQVWISFLVYPPPAPAPFNYTFTSDGSVTSGLVDKQHG